MSVTRILVVDDNALVCMATARLVEHVTGCPAQCCSSGEEALRIFKDARGDFTCVISDLDMPGMNGLQLGSTLRAEAPGLKLLFMTGNPGALEWADISGHGFDCMLAKPFDMAIIGETLRRLLPPLNNSAASGTHNLYRHGVPFFER